ncbi:MAG: hypothetical protein NZ990_18460 [Myxococcota bacterium]|nr:hypothetical protein [Myxococcota bacterium]
MEDVSRFEVRCPSCDVSFPVGTRRCFHCGARTGPSRFRSPDVPPTLVGSDRDREEDFQLPFEAVGNPEPIADEPPRTVKRGRLNAGVSLIWIVMALVFALMRACGGG